MSMLGMRRSSCSVSPFVDGPLVLAGAVPARAARTWWEVRSEVRRRRVAPTEEWCRTGVVE